MDTGQESFDNGEHSKMGAIAVATDTPEKRLQEYEALKFELAQLIREGSSAAWRAKNDTLEREFQSLLKRLAEDRFYLTLAGQFSRGKSTLMNAILGMDRLPTWQIRACHNGVPSAGLNAIKLPIGSLPKSNLPAVVTKPIPVAVAPSNMCFRTFSPVL